MANYILNVSRWFSAAHRLRGYAGKCARIHGHNYRVSAEIAVKELDELGLAIDYFDVKQMMEGIIKHLDHYYINEVKPFDTINPTAENIAKWFYQQLTAALQSNPKANTPSARLLAVTLWESENFSVRYSEES